jgi:hypothetical protein
MLHTVKKVEYLEEYKLKLTFNDKSIKTVNLENMIKSTKNMFVPLLDLDYFKNVKCNGQMVLICAQMFFMKLGKHNKNKYSPL